MKNKIKLGYKEVELKDLKVGDIVLLMQTKDMGLKWEDILRPVTKIGTTFLHNHKYVEANGKRFYDCEDSSKFKVVIYC